jgi:Holliday junction resolvase RusA-like endonuclease
MRTQFDLSTHAAVLLSRMQKISFVVHGPPVPKARARVVRSGSPTEPKTRSFTPIKSADYEAHVGMIALAARTKVPKWPGLNRGVRLGLAVRVYRSREQGDLDNFMKSALDACNGVLWADDWQVRRFGECFVESVTKGQERLEVDVWTLD